MYRLIQDEVFIIVICLFESISSSKTNFSTNDMQPRAIKWSTLFVALLVYRQIQNEVSIIVICLFEPISSSKTNLSTNDMQPHVIK